MKDKIRRIIGSHYHIILYVSIFAVIIILYNQYSGNKNIFSIVITGGFILGYLLSVYPKYSSFGSSLLATNSIFIISLIVFEKKLSIYSEINLFYSGITTILIIVLIIIINHKYNLYRFLSNNTYFIYSFLVCQYRTDSSANKKRLF